MEFHFSCGRIASVESGVEGEAQNFLDGLMIKHVHYKTGTPPFYIHHCPGTAEMMEGGMKWALWRGPITSPPLFSPVEAQIEE